MPRLFTAVEIPKEIGESLAMLRGGLPGARWIDPENYHLTLRFIGDIDDRLARDIAFMLGDVDRPPFELRLEGLSSFGGRKPRAVVAAVGGSSALYDLQAEHERLMQRVGLEPEGRKYSPHITLARLRELVSASGRRLSRLPPAVPVAAVRGLAFCALFVAGVGGRRSLRGRGRLPAQRARAIAADALALKKARRHKSLQIKPPHLRSAGGCALRAGPRL